MKGDMAVQTEVPNLKTSHQVSGFGPTMKVVSVRYGKDLGQL